LSTSQADPPEEARDHQPRPTPHHAAEEVGGHCGLTLCDCGFVDSVGTCLTEQGIRSRFCGAGRFLQLHFFFNFALHFSEHLDMSFLLIFNADDVIWTDGTLATRPKGGDFTSPARETVYVPYAYQTPRSFSFSTRLSF